MAFQPLSHNPNLASTSDAQQQWAAQDPGLTLTLAPLRQAQAGHLWMVLHLFSSVFLHLLPTPPSSVMLLPCSTGGMGHTGVPLASQPYGRCKPGWALGLDLHPAALDLHDLSPALVIKLAKTPEARCDLKSKTAHD